MFGDLNYPRRVWTEAGVRRMDVGIPGETRPGVLAPEVLTALERGAATDDHAQQLAALAREGSWLALRNAPPRDADLTTEPLREHAFLIPRGEEPIPVTAYCLEARWSLSLPAVVYFHGGGFRTGSRKSVEHAMRLLAQLSGGVVFSVEYRLAPEHRFPCATQDAWQALRWLHRHAAEFGADPDRFVVSGDSAGGNLAAACARRDRNMRTGLLRRQILIYPVLCQMPFPPEDDSQLLASFSIDETQRLWILPCITATRQVVSGGHLYTRTPEEDRCADASPLLDANFAGLPPTVLFCGQFDYLTLQAAAYARKLASAGVEATLVTYRGMPHGFMNHLGQYPQATALLRDMATALRQA